MKTVKISVMFFLHATVCVYQISKRYLFKLQRYGGFLTSLILLFSTFYADIKRNSNSRTFSRNIQFEVINLENGLADYRDTYINL